VLQPGDTLKVQAVYVKGWENLATVTDKNGMEYTLKVSDWKPFQ